MTSVDASGSALMNVSYQSVNYSLDSPTEHGKCDTADPKINCDPLAAGMAALAGQSFTMRVSPDGRVFDVEGVEKIMKRAEDALSAAPADIKLSALAAVRQNCGPRATQEKMEDIFDFLPPHPVEVGERWSMSRATTAGIPAYFTSYCKITSRNNGTAAVKCFSDIRPNAGAPAVPYGEGSIATIVSGFQEGKLTMDESTGLVLRSGSTTQLTGRILVTTGGKTTSYSVTISSANTVEQLQPESR